LETVKQSLKAQIIWVIIHNIVAFLPAVLLNQIVKQISASSTNNRTWIYLFSIFFCHIISAIADGQAQWSANLIGSYIRKVIIFQLHEDVLKRKNRKSKPRLSDKLDLSQHDDDEEASTSPSNASILNLMSADAWKVSSMAYSLPDLLISAPIRLIMTVSLLFHLVGASSIIGLVVAFLLIPLNLLIARLFAKAQKDLLEATDARIKLTQDVMTNIRIIKYFTWESGFAKKVDEKRSIEIAYMRRRYFIWLFATVFWFLSPVFVTASTFFAHDLFTTKAMSTAEAFTTISLFALLRIPIDLFAANLSDLQQSMVSLERIENYLHTEQTPKQENEKVRNEIDNLFDESHISKGEVVFRILGKEIKIKTGRTNFVCGPTASGKSTLLGAILEELLSSRKSLERIAYCAQESWIVDGTIKHNILFGSDYDHLRYNDVLTACALRPDLQSMTCGDETSLGQNGAQLSGGQRQRIAFARALYSNANWVLLDDVLSALDMETAKHICDNAINGPLMVNRTCIIVTNDISIFDKASQWILQLSHDGSIKQSLEIVPDRMGLYQDKQTNKSNSACTPSPVLETIADNGNHNAPQEKELDQITSVASHESNAAEPATKWPTQRTLITFLSNLGGYKFWLCMLMLTIAQQLCSVASLVWLERMSAIQTDDSSSLSSDQCPNPYTSVVEFLINTKDICPAVLSPQMTQTQGNMKFLWTYFGLSLLPAIVACVREGFLFLHGSIKASETIHTHLITSIINAPLNFFDSPTGKGLGCLSAYIPVIDRTFIENGLQIVNYTFNIISIIVMIEIFVGPAIILPAIFIIAIFFGIGYFYVPTSRTLKEVEAIAAVPMHQHIGEAVSGSTTIQAYCATDIYTSRLEDKIDDASKPSLYLAAINCWLGLRVEFVGALIGLCAGIVILFGNSEGSSFILDIDAPRSALVLTYVTTLSESLLWLVRLCTEAANGLVIIKKVNDLSTLKSEAATRSSSTAEVLSSIDLRSSEFAQRERVEAGSSSKLEFRNVSAAYGNTHRNALDSVNLTVLPGEHVAIIGRTGAGKSSLALSIMGSGPKVTSGGIYIDDQEIRSISLVNLRSVLVAIVPQVPVLFDGTVRSNMDPFNQYTDEDICCVLEKVNLLPHPTKIKSDNRLIESNKKRRDSGHGIYFDTEIYINANNNGNVQIPIKHSPEITSSINLIDLMNANQINEKRESEQTDGGNQLDLLLSTGGARCGLSLGTKIDSTNSISLGQKQLICLGRAMLRKPKILILDEATASVDSATIKIIRKVVANLKDITVVSIAHQMEAIALFDRVVSMKDGRVL